jgi:hypothetical protein
MRILNFTPLEMHVLTVFGEARKDGYKIAYYVGTANYNQFIEESLFDVIKKERIAIVKEEYIDALDHCDPETMVKSICALLDGDQFTIHYS